MAASRAGQEEGDVSERFDSFAAFRTLRLCSSSRPPLGYSLATSRSGDRGGPWQNERPAAEQQPRGRMEPRRFNSQQGVFTRFGGRCATANAGMAISSLRFSSKAFRSLGSVRWNPFACSLLTQLQSLSFELSCKGHSQKLPIFTEASSCFPSELCLKTYLPYI